MSRRALGANRAILATLLVSFLLVSFLLGEAARSEEPGGYPARPDRPPAVSLAPVVAAAIQPEPDPDPESDGEPAAPLPTIPETRVLGQPAPFPANPLGAVTVITPSNRATAAGNTGSSVSVITQEQIRSSGQTTVLDVLRGAVGLDVVQSGGPGRATSIFLRGANSEHTKVLLDGAPINDPSGATRAFDFSTLTIDNIERIEIVRGPQSLIYGSDALGGVINIITKRGQGPLSVTASAEGGSFGTARETIGVSGGDDFRYYSFGASYFENNGFSAVSGRFGGFEPDFYRNATFSGRFGVNPTETLNIDYVFRYVDADAEIDDFLADNPRRQNRLEQFTNRLQFQTASIDGFLTQQLGLSLTDYTRIDTDPGFFGTPRFDGQTRQIDWQANLNLTDCHTLTAGADYLHEEASSTFLAEETQFLAGVYVQDSFVLGDRFFTTVGARWDDHSAAGPAQTYRVTELVRFTETGTEFHGSLGRGFRAPSIDQRFGFVGNPDLRPEFSKGWDVGVRQALHCDCLVVDVTYFRNDFDDLIVFDPSLPGPGGFGALNNIARARTSGVECLADWQLTDVTALFANYTYTDTLDVENNRELLRRPRHKASLGITRSFDCERASLSMYAVYVGPRLDFDAIGSLVTLDDYITFNLSGRYRLSCAWELYGRVDNLFDNDYEEVFGFATSGIAAYGGVRVSF